MTDFYVYLHARPDGQVFYVGKGAGRRAWDFSPSRRTEWHLRVARKYGRANIRVMTHGVESENLAFELERFLIAEHRLSGRELINLTDGGEGCSGRKPTQKMLDGLKKGRGKDRFARLSEDSKKSILDGLANGRKNISAWQKSEAGQAHFKKLVAAGKAARELMAPRTLTCPTCSKNFETVSWRAVYCSDKCGQIQRRRNGRS